MSTPSSLELEVPVPRPAAHREKLSPVLSVIVTSRRERSALQALVSQLAPQCARAGATLVVARSGTPGEVAGLAKLMPEAHFVPVPPGASDAQMRALAMVQASGDVVLFTDEQRGVPRYWLDALRGRLSRGEPVAPPPTPADVPRPLLSVIVPVHQGAKVLPKSLEALERSDLPRSLWELIVVDDASTDDSALAAASFADVVVRIPSKPYGPAYARNRGFQASRGEYVVFVDADVCVHASTLRRFAAAFRDDPEVSAVSGSYDDCPPVAGYVSRYRNLLQHFHHQQSAGPVDRFWAVCGAVRSSVFAEAGMYDEWRFRRPTIEDIELGRRIRRLGYTAVLRPDIQATHLKRWTLRTMIANNLHNRGVPWMRLDTEAADRSGPKARPGAQSVNTLLTWVAFGILVWAALARDWRPGAGALAVLLPVLLRNRHQYAFFARKGGARFALAAVPLDLLNYLVNGAGLAAGWLMGHVVGDAKPDPAVQAFAEVGIKTWPPVPARRLDAEAAAAAAAPPSTP
jgi:GT2 family glycosyltransferase